jgi:signal peptidase I
MRRGRTPKRKRKQSLLGFVIELIVIVVVGLLVTTLLRAFVFQPFEVPSGSMENTLQVNDKIIAQRIVDFRRGDVVVFEDANGWLAGRADPGPVRSALEFVGVLPSSGEGHLVKRVVGMPGDRVQCCDDRGRLLVNGYALDESAYLYTDVTGMVRPAEKPFEVIVPEGHLFVLGDHRNASGDSRCQLQAISRQGGPPGGSAFVPVESVVGSVPIIVSPIDRIQRLQTPDSFAGVPAPQQPAPSAPVIVQVSEGC